MSPIFVILMVFVVDDQVQLYQWSDDNGKTIAHYSSLETCEAQVKVIETKFIQLGGKDVPHHFGCKEVQTAPQPADVQNWKHI